jgi:hypothetical protein
MAADDDGLLYLSVKQLNQILGCPRQWAMHNLFGVPYIEGGYQEEGNQVHAQMKALIRRQTPVFPPESRVGKMARELFQTFCMARSKQAVAEMHHTVALHDYGIKVGLRCDFADENTREIKDWKVTGAPDANAKLRDGSPWTPTDISGDVQFNVYAHLLMQVVWDCDHVFGSMCFVTRKFEDGKTPKVWPLAGSGSKLNHCFLRDEVQKWWDTYVPPAVQLIRDLKAAGIDNPLHVPHNGHHCEFSGKFCDASGRCKFVSSPVMKYKDLRLPVLPSTKG